MRFNRGQGPTFFFHEIRGEPPVRSRVICTLVDTKSPGVYVESFDDLVRNKLSPEENALWPPGGI